MKGGVFEHRSSPLQMKNYSILGRLAKQSHWVVIIDRETWEATNSHLRFMIGMIRRCS